jgi:cytochrome c peroxidase
MVTNTVSENRRALCAGIGARWTATGVAVVLSGLILAAIGGDDNPPNTGMADPAALMSAYDRYVGGARESAVILSLSNLRGLSSEAVNAGGTVSVDLTLGRVTSTVELLPADSSFDLWLIDNRAGPGHTTLAESADVLIRVGTYALASGRHTLSVTLGPAAFAGFFPDRAFVVRAGQSPVDSFVLTGPSTLFDRLRRRQVRLLDNDSSARGFDPNGTARVASFAKLVAQGRQLFLNEQFNGNGRTCGTCHAESNNFTVDPDFISTLPSTDPLFVAETNPQLAALENPDLLRQFGLIVVNADGFDPSKGFVLRSAQNVQALGNSTTPQDPTDGVDFSTNGRNPNPPERLGWGNDGAPLRDFALVAIAQHAPRTLNRTPGFDFRVATDEELDALVAYQLPLGRQEDFDLPSLELRSPLATSGKALYLDTGNLFEPGHKNCNACHFNAGGTTGSTFNPEAPGFPDADASPKGFNIGAATGVNDIPLALQLGLPRDGGFGVLLTIFGSFGNTDDIPGFGHFELEEFNAPPLVESADTAPFFHNHTVKDLESAVAFYGTQPFQTSIGGGGTPVTISADPTDPEVQAIAAFLRVLNALENIRSAINVAERGRKMTTVDDVRELAALSLAETIDAMQVLSGGALASRIEPAMASARVRLLAARLALEAARHLRNVPTIARLLESAIRSLRSARLALANPATLPASFRN